MILPFQLSFNLFLKTFKTNILDFSTEDLLSLISVYISSDYGEVPMYHCSSKSSSSRDDLVLHSSYTRNLVVLHLDGSRDEQEVKIPVYESLSTGHYHAVVSPYILIPYRVYSLFSIILVLYYALILKHSVNETCDFFQISVSTYYDWLHSFRSTFEGYYQIAKSNRNHSKFKDFISSLCSLNFLYKVVNTMITSSDCPPFFFPKDSS